MMDELVKIVKDIGFPMAVTIYLLVRYDFQMGEIRKGLNKMCVSMEGLKKAVDKDD